MLFGNYLWLEAGRPCRRPLRCEEQVPQSKKRRALIAVGKAELRDRKRLRRATDSATPGACSCPLCVEPSTNGSAGLTQMNPYALVLTLLGSSALHVFCGGAWHIRLKAQPHSKRGPSHQIQICAQPPESHQGRDGRRSEGFEFQGIPAAGSLTPLGYRAPSASGWLASWFLSRNKLRLVG